MVTYIIVTQDNITYTFTEKQMESAKQRTIKLAEREQAK